MKNIRVLIAEAHPVTREGICAILQKAPNIELVGKAADSQEAVMLAQEYQPDILLLDLKIPGIQPAELVARLYHSCPQMKVLALSDNWKNASVRDLALAGVSVHVGKTDAAENIVNAIHTVNEDGAWISQTVLEQLIEKGDRPTLVKEFGLTDRELDVLRLVAAGKTNRGIALTLEISVKTVEKCLTTIYEKLGVTSRVLAAVWAVRNSLA